MEALKEELRQREGEASDSEVAFFRFGLGEESIVHVRPSCGRRDSARVDAQ